MFLLFVFFLLQPTSSKWCFYSHFQCIVIATMTNNAEDFPSSEPSLQEQMCELTWTILLVCATLKLSCQIKLLWLNSSSHKTQNVLLQTGREEQCHTHCGTLQQTAAECSRPLTDKNHSILCGTVVLQLLWHFTPVLAFYSFFYCM